MSLGVGDMRSGPGPGGGTQSNFAAGACPFDPGGVELSWDAVRPQRT